MDALLSSSSSFLATAAATASSSLLVPHQYYRRHHQATKPQYPPSFRHHVSAVRSPVAAATTTAVPPPPQVDPSSVPSSQRRKAASNITMATKGPTRRADADMKWFDVPGFNPVHTVNAWEEDGGATVVLVAPNVLSVEHALDRMELVHSCVEMVRIDTRTGVVSRTPLSAANLDFGVINPSYQGRRNRYAYMGVGDPQPKVGGVVKLDYYRQGQRKAGSGDCVVASRMYGPGRFGGEPFFVAAPDEGAEEDDGYLVSYLHDENTGESCFLVMDARSPELEVVAEVALPRRVPYGFHGLFVSKAELQGQRP